MSSFWILYFYIQKIKLTQKEKEFMRSDFCLNQLVSQEKLL